MRLVRIATNVALVVIAIVVGMGLGEGAVRILAPQKMSGAWFVVGPLGILMNKPSGVARDVLVPGRTALYEFNGFNQRGRDPPDPAAARVLVLGDSFTFGLGLALEDSYVQILQRRLDEPRDRPRVQLLNAAVGGWGTADQLAYLEAFGPTFNPSAVVVFVNAWDVERARTLDIYRVTDDGKGLTVHPVPARQHAVKRLVENNPAYLYLLDHSHLVQLIRQAFVVAVTWMRQGSAAAPVASGPSSDANARGGEATEGATLQFKLIMRRMAVWCATRGVQFTVLTTGWPEIDYPWLEAMMQAEGIFFRDLGDTVAEPVRQDRDRYAIVGDDHPSEAAARLIADAAWPILEERLRGLQARPMP